jgi:hypothetical protein
VNTKGVHPECSTIARESSGATITLEGEGARFQGHSMAGMIQRPSLMVACHSSRAESRSVTIQRRNTVDAVAAEIDLPRSYAHGVGGGSASPGSCAGTGTGA